MCYSYFSGAHRVFSRLDYIFTLAGEITNIEEAEYKARGISDHSPLWVKMGRKQKLGGNNWRLNAWELKNPHIAKAIKADSRIYFQENMGSVASAVTLWEAYKTVFRDRVQNAIADEKRAGNAEIREIESRLLECESKVADKGTPERVRQMEILRKEYQDLTTGQVKLHLLATQHRLYEAGDKAGKLLAWLGNKERESR